MKREHILKMVMLAMLVAIGVVISPILRVEGMCPMAHLINIVCSVFLGPWYSLLCATLIGIIRMTLMGIPPLALTGAVFGAFLSGVFYRLSGGKILCAVLGEVFGTGVIGALASYPVMTYIVGREGLTWAFYIPSFIGGTLIGGSIAFVFLMALRRNGLLAKFQHDLGAKVYEHHSCKTRCSKREMICAKRRRSSTASRIRLRSTTVQTGFSPWAESLSWRSIPTRWRKSRA